MSHFVRASKYRHVYVQSPRTGEAYSNIRLSTAVGEQNYIKANPKYFAVALSVRLFSVYVDGWVGLQHVCGTGEDEGKGFIVFQSDCSSLCGWPITNPPSPFLLPPSPSPPPLPPSISPHQGGGGPFTCISYENKGPLPIAPPVFSGHTSNVLDFDFSPFHDHLIASASEDTSVKLWGIPEGGMVGNQGEAMVGMKRKKGHGGKVCVRASLKICHAYCLLPFPRPPIHTQHKKRTSLHP